jgi:hypothetical protein
LRKFEICGEFISHLNFGYYPKSLCCSSNSQCSIQPKAHIWTIHSQSNPVNSTTPYFSEIYINIILPVTHN